MAGVFGTWQPIYAEAGLATFPVDADAKKPSVGNPLKAGRRASAQWALKFSEANALGFACGTRSRITVVDIDDPDENLVADAMAKLGPTPVVVRTASGKHHLWYRHNGERRSPRKLAREMGLSGPVDILGERGFAIAPPSLRGGSTYEWTQGSLADLANVPMMRKSLAAPANDSGGVAEPSVEGQRNDLLFRACLGAARTASSLAGLLGFAHELNNSGQWPALPLDEVERAAASAWRIQEEGRNLVGKGRAVVLSGDEMANLRPNPEAMYLYTVLRENHWGRDFCIANAWHDDLPCGAWSLRRFKAARDYLLKRGLVVLVSRERPGVAAIYRFSSPPTECGGRRGGGV